MLTLALLRHAKSSWSDPEIDDHDRPLAKRGTKAAPQIARFLMDHKILPDLVLCSTAVRTRATLTLVLSELHGVVPTLAFDDDLYLADPKTLLAHLREVPVTAKTVMVVGHNPGLHSLALELTGRGDRKLIGALAREFPTAALAVLSFPTAEWRDIGGALGVLEHFVTPKRL